MKPNRLLPKPDQPHFAVKRKNDAIEKVPEWRLGQLLKTGCFQNFLRNHKDWLTTEGQQNLAAHDVIGPKDICPKRIEEIPASVREESEFNHKWDEAVKDPTGERAFEFYEEYKRRKIQIDGESGADKFLGLAKERKCKAAETEWLKTSGIVGVERRKLERALKDGGVTNINHVLFFFARVKKLKIKIYDCSFSWCIGCTMGTYLSQGRGKFKSGKDWMGYPTREKTSFLGRVVDRDAAAHSIWVKFLASSIEDLSDGEIVWLTAFFFAANEFYPKCAWTAQELNQVRAIGKILRDKAAENDDEEPLVW